LMNAIIRSDNRLIHRGGGAGARKDASFRGCGREPAQK
jgi:hypothetical protein